MSPERRQSVEPSTVQHERQPRHGGNDLVRRFARYAAPLGIVAVCLTAVATAVAASSPPPGLDPPMRVTPVVPPAQYGPTWLIIEEDIRSTILHRFNAKLPELKQELADSIRNHRIPAIPRPTTATGRSVQIDPSLTLDTDLLAPDGRLIARAGDRLNPLQALPFLRTYLVLNGADPRQVDWALREIAARPTKPMTLLLTEGNLSAVLAAVPPGTRVYPAPAELFARFPVVSVPARLARAGTGIQIDFIGERDLEK